MTHTIDGVTITPEMIQMLKDWAPASKIDKCRPAMHVTGLVKVQDRLIRFLDEVTKDSERMTICGCLATLGYVKDDLETMTKLWEGGEE